MSKAPRTLIKSRETLQTICNNPNELRKYELFDRILDMVWYDISKKINKTKHVIGFIGYNTDWTNCNNIYYRDGITESFMMELVEILKKEYLDCNVTYTETKDNKGKLIEQLIIIDWT